MTIYRSISPELRKSQSFIVFMSCLVFLFLIFSTEYASPGTRSIYSSTFGQFRIPDLFIMSVFVLILMGKVSRKFHARETKFGYINGIFWIWILAIFYGVSLGLLNGSSNIFFGWRSLFYSLTSYLFFSEILKIEQRLYRILDIFCFLTSMYAFLLLLNFIFFGGGVLDTSIARTPVFDGPTLTAFVLAYSLLVNRILGNGHLKKSRKGILFLFILPLVITVFLSLRRTYIAELVLASLLLVIYSTFQKRKLFPFIALIFSYQILYTFLSSSVLFNSRIQSMNIFSNNFMTSGATNRDHLLDVKIAFDVLVNSNFVGKGVGVSWENPGIYFKEVSFGVHNGPLHVALLFGIPGLLAWIYTLGYFCKYFIHSLSINVERVPLDLGVGMSSWFISSSLVSTLFSPWNMSSSQTCLLVGFIFAFMQARLKVLSPL